MVIADAATLSFPSSMRRLPARLEDCAGTEGSADVAAPVKSSRRLVVVCAALELAEAEALPARSESLREEAAQLRSAASLGLCLKATGGCAGISADGVSLIAACAATLSLIQSAVKCHHSRHEVAYSKEDIGG